MGPSETPTAQAVREGTLRQISKLSALLGKKSNPFWQKFGNRLSSSLLISTANSRAIVDEFYVTERLGQTDSDELTNLRSVLRGQMGDLVDSLGVLELDLIDFLLNVPDYRVLALIGFRGVGKSTLVQYVCLKLRKLAPALRHFVPIHIDLLAFRKRDAEAARGLERRLVELAKQALLSLEPDGNLDEQLRHDLHWLRDQQSPSFDDLDALVDALKVQMPAYEPLLIFDNTDQLHPETLARILDEAQSLWITHKVATILASRPST